VGKLAETTLISMRRILTRWDKCINVGGGYVEKQMLSFQVRILDTCFKVYINS
jgi:hypothetical protein